MSIILYACIFRQSFFRGLQVAGLLIKKELAAFSMVLTSPQKPLLAIVGGAKISDKIKLINNIIDKADGIIICGAMAYTFLKVCFGMQIGNSRFDAKSFHRCFFIGDGDSGVGWLPKFGKIIGCIDLFLNIF